MKAKQISVIAVIVLLVSLFTVPAFADYDKETIQAVQQALNSAGFDCGTPDGIAGKGTAAAISAFQEAHGMTVDGQISDELLASLGIGDDEGAAGEEPAAAEVPEDTAETNDAEELLFDSSKFDETMYEGTWYTIKRDSAEDLAYEIYIPTDWTVEEPTLPEESPTFVMPEEFSQFEFSLGESLSVDEIGGKDEFISAMTSTGLFKKISVNGIDDVLYLGMYYPPDPIYTSYTDITDELMIFDEAGVWGIGGVYSPTSPTEDGQEKEGLEPFLLISRNILNSLRIAGTEEE